MEYLKFSTRLILKLHSQILPYVNKIVDTWDLRLKKTNIGMIFSLSGQPSDRKINYIKECSIFSLYPNIVSKDALHFIVPFAIISDYLQELITREGPYDATSLNQFFSSIIDAIDINRTIGNYYFYRPYIKDNGYLNELVEECRRQIIKNKQFSLVAQPIKEFAELYSDLQFSKFMREPYRKEMITAWSEKYNKYTDVLPFEFFAASDSILGITALFTASLSQEITSDEIDKICKAYFPWICGLHKLLDNYVNSNEVKHFDSFNSTDYYETIKDCEERIAFFGIEALKRCETLKHPEFHTGIVEYLLSLYLSDPRALSGIKRLASLNILKEINHKISLNHCLCKFFRLTDKIS